MRRQHFEEIRAVALHLALADAGDGEERGQVLRHAVGDLQQRRIVEEFDNFAEQTQHLARLYEQKLAALEALKKSLLHQAFTGAL